MKNKIIIVVLILIMGIVATIFVNTDLKSEVLAEEKSTLEIEKPQKEEPSKVKVDIKGAVKKAGVYEVDTEQRVNDVIKLAGGLNRDANTNYVNLSAKVTDEMVIWIYTNKEIKELKLEQSSAKYMVKQCNCPMVDNTACLNNKDTTNGNADSNNQSGIININNATTEQLMTLEGVGESKAKSIIEYREKNGQFNKIEDIMNVDGIGEALYNKIKNHITV